MDVTTEQVGHTVAMETYAREHFSTLGLAHIHRGFLEMWRNNGDTDRKKRSDAYINLLVANPRGNGLVSIGAPSSQPTGNGLVSIGEFVIDYDKLTNKTVVHVY